MQTDNPAAPAEQQKRILVVEEESAIVSILERILQDLGYSVLTAASGEVALQLLEEIQGQVVLIVIDVMMALMNGKELARIVRGKYPDGSIKMLFMSGGDRQDLVAKGFLSPDAAFISKPFNVAHFRRCIQEILDTT